MPYAEGTLVREQGHAEIYLIRDCERLWIPNPYVLTALGLDHDNVVAVPAGGLDNIPIDESWAPLGNKTPGSTVFVSIRDADIGGALFNGRVYWPLDLATTKSHVAWGEDARTVELRGWISATPPDAPDDPNRGINRVDPDFAYNLVPDIAWTLAQEIDLNELIRLGNILQLGLPDDPNGDPRARCSTPGIHMEISGFPPKGQWDRQVPPDWNDFGLGVTLDNKDAGMHDQQLISWPYNPRSPAPLNVEFMGGEYVRVYGSICSDKAHYLNPNDPKNAPSLDTPAKKAMNSAVGLWHNANRANYPDDPARWTEIHPPDYIELLWSPDPNVVDSHGFVPPGQVLRGVAVIAPGTTAGKAAPTCTLDTTIMAPPRPAANAVLRYREIVGPESTLGWLTEANASNTGAQIALLPAGDGIHIRVTVKGDNVLGRSAMFRALYWLYWDVQPAPRPHGEQAVGTIATLLLDDDRRKRSNRRKR